jgi:Flp pilus assembly pilin Flp
VVLKVTVGAILVHVVLVATVKELVATIASPWSELVEAFQQLVVTVLEHAVWK